MLSSTLIKGNSFLKEEAHTLDTQLETWRPVGGFEGRYEVSDCGNVRSLNYCGRKGLVALLVQVVDHRGYKCLTLPVGPKKKLNFRVHSMVMDAFVGPRPALNEVNHKDGDKHNNRLENLEYCTRSDNVIHAFRTKLRVAKRGADCYQTKLSDDQVVEIRERAMNGESQQLLAKEFGTCQQNISSIKTGKRWAHVTRKEG